MCGTVLARIGITFVSGQSFRESVGHPLGYHYCNGTIGIEVRVSDCFGEDLLGNADFVLKVSNKRVVFTLGQCGQKKRNLNEGC